MTHAAKLSGNFNNYAKTLASLDHPMHCLNFPRIKNDSLGRNNLYSLIA